MRLVFLAALAAVFLVTTTTARAGSGAVVGINDDGFTYNYPAMAPSIAPLGNVQVGVWRAPDDQSQWSIPLDRGVLLQAICSEYYLENPQKFASDLLGLIQRHRNVREVQVCNEPDLGCSIGCQAEPLHHTRFYGKPLFRYFDLLRATREKLAGTGVLVLGFGFSAPFRHWDPKFIGWQYHMWYEQHGNIVWHCRAYDVDGICIVGIFTGHPYDKPLMDALAYHPYCGWKPWITMRVWRRWYRVTKDLPGGVPPLWFTESGIDTEETAGQFGYFFGAALATNLCGGNSEGSEAQQAALYAPLGREVRKLHRRGIIGGWFSYLWQDERDINRMQSGVRRPDGSAKPALLTFSAAVAGVLNG
jgi:hypothetical protein